MVQINPPTTDSFLVFSIRLIKYCLHPGLAVHYSELIHSGPSDLSAGLNLPLQPFLKAGDGTSLH